MLELLFLRWFTAHIGETVRKKGHGAGGYKFLAVFLWFAGEAIGVALSVAAGGHGWAVYLPALLGAGAGALVAQGIAAASRDVYALRA